MKDSVASPSPPLGALALEGAGHPVVRTLRQFRGRELRALPQAAPHCQPCDGASLDASPRPRSQADGLPLAAAALACSGVTQGHPSSSGDPPLPGTRHSRSPQRPSRLTDLHSDSPPSAQSGHTAPTLRHLRPACPLSRARLGVQTGQLSTGPSLAPLFQARGQEGRSWPLKAPLAGVSHRVTISRYPPSAVPVRLGSEESIPEVEVSSKAPEHPRGKGRSRRKGEEEEESAGNRGRSARHPASTPFPGGPAGRRRPGPTPTGSPPGCGRAGARRGARRHPARHPPRRRGPGTRTAARAAPRGRRTSPRRVPGRCRRTHLPPPPLPPVFRPPSPPPPPPPPPPPEWPRRPRAGSGGAGGGGGGAERPQAPPAGRPSPKPEPQAPRLAAGGPDAPSAFRRRRPPPCSFLTRSAENDPRRFPGPAENASRKPTFP
ncbi:basic proline-rich protein-like [Ursus arctos]|uniref:basic proline-rich protein-like n=1 Tax=Ursus arctos TaxID=9644 RepID=UPI002017D3CB|nr:basic proline-rich protein-like [Ursus arctos]